MKFPTLIAVIPVFLMVACSGTGARKNATPAPARKSMQQRIDEKNGYKQDANGNWTAQSDKRSSFENQGQDRNFAGKSFKANAYKTGDYTKKSWWGNKQYDRKAYAGSTDASRFQKSSDLQSKGASEAGNAANIPSRYQTTGYATNAAREAGAAVIEKPSNDRVENRRSSFEQPEIIDWREQRSLTMDQSKGILGR